MKALQNIQKWLHSLLSMDAGPSSRIDSHKWESKNNEVIDAFERAVHIKPDDAEAYYALAVTYDSVGRSEEAKAAYREAIRIEPDFPPAHFLLGNSYVIDGNKESALEVHKVLCRLDTGLADTLLDSIHGLALTKANDS